MELYNAIYERYIKDMPNIKWKLECGSHFNALETFDYPTKNDVLLLANLAYRTFQQFRVENNQFMVNEPVVISEASSTIGRVICFDEKNILHGGIELLTFPDSSASKILIMTMQSNIAQENIFSARLGNLYLQNIKNICNYVKNKQFWISPKSIYK